MIFIETNTESKSTRKVPYFFAETCLKHPLGCYPAPVLRLRSVSKVTKRVTNIKKVKNSVKKAF